MKIGWYDAEEWEKEYIQGKEIEDDIEFINKSLDSSTVEKADNFDAVAVFVSSEVDENVIEKLEADLICCRSTGFDHVDLEAAEEQGITVCNVPEYGGTTVAEHTFGLILALSRKIYSAIRRVDEGKFEHSGLRGFDLKGKTLGVIGTGTIGKNVIRVANGFDMEVLASDPVKDKEAAERMGFSYVELEKLLEKADIITLHCPLNDATRYMLGEDEFQRMNETLLVNTARGELVKTKALLKALQNDNLKAAGLDVLEEECRIEEDIEVIKQQEECDIEKVLEGHMLMERDDVLITPHNAFNSIEAMNRIADTTIENLNNRENSVV